MNHLEDANDFMAYVASAPTPRHAVAESVRRLTAVGFSDVAASTLQSPDSATLATSGYTTRAGSLIAWRRSETAGPTRVITAHTDSPNLRIKPHPDTSSAQLHQLGVESYGGLLLNSWLDRDLGLAGHVVIRSADGDAIETRLINVDRAVLRIPQLAIHLDREISQKGLLLNKQQHMKPIWGAIASGDSSDDDDGDASDTGDGGDAVTPTLSRLLGAELDIDAERILAWELMMHDVAPPSLWGWHDEFIASPRIDNQLSCWAATEALAQAGGKTGLSIIALFDHEEVGSTSATGADSTLLSGVLDALLAGAGTASAADDGSLCVSADCAHATHPNYADRHDPDHQIHLNRGPVIKVNANERYATTALGHALFADACAQADVPHQVFVNRSDLACGSTVGPLTAARTGLETVDVGAPQLAMHSARETTGAHDPGMLRRALGAIFT